MTYEEQLDEVLEWQIKQAKKDKRIKELEALIEKMKCCGNCIHCKYDENEESYEFCEKHQQIGNVTIVPCKKWKGR